MGKKSNKNVTSKEDWDEAKKARKEAKQAKANMSVEKPNDIGIYGLKPAGIREDIDDRGIKYVTQMWNVISIGGEVLSLATEHGPMPFMIPSVPIPVSKEVRIARIGD